MITTVIAFIATLGLLVVVHEYGHYRVAVACGVKVLRFSVGFGRVLWRRQASPDATEFVVCTLPLGGYVRMLDEREGPVPTAELGSAFNRKPLAQRAAIVSAGPLANLLLAVLLYAASHWIGVEEAKPVVAAPPAGSLAEAAGLRAGDWVQAASADGAEWQDVASMSDLRWLATQAVLRGEALDLRVSARDGRGARTVHMDLSTLGTREVDPAVLRRIGLGNAFSEAVLGDVVAGGPGAAGGLRRGDRVLAIDGAPVADASQVVDRVRGALQDGHARPQAWRVERGGQVLELTVTPRVAGDAGQRYARVDVVPGPPAEMVTVRYGFTEGLARGAARTWEVSALTVKMLGRMIVGEASLKNLSGPLTIADAAGQSAQLGPAYFLGFLALVSVSLGVLNLLPLPMLDGGHLMYYIFEAVTGHPVSELWLARLQRGGIALLLTMMSVALFNDVVRLFGQH